MQNEVSFVSIVEHIVFFLYSICFILQDAVDTIGDNAATGELNCEHITLDN